MKQKKEYLVVECPKCKKYLLAISTNKTRACPYCGKKLTVEKLQALVRKDDQDSARVYLQKLKFSDGTDNDRR
jgi:DNA-directed RNA polymerase subunit RPC12/RpoP